MRGWYCVKECGRTDLRVY